MEARSILANAVQVWAVTCPFVWEMSSGRQLEHAPKERSAPSDIEKKRTRAEYTTPPISPPSGAACDSSGSPAPSPAREAPAASLVLLFPKQYSSYAPRERPLGIGWTVERGLADGSTAPDSRRLAANRCEGNPKLFDCNCCHWSPNHWKRQSFVAQCFATQHDAKSEFDIVFRVPRGH